MRVSGISALGPFHGGRRLPPFPSPGVNMGDFCTLLGFPLSLEGIGTSNTQVCRDLRCCSRTVRFSTHQGPGSHPRRLLLTHSSRLPVSLCALQILPSTFLTLFLLPHTHCCCFNEFLTVALVCSRFSAPVRLPPCHHSFLLSLLWLHHAARGILVP